MDVANRVQCTALRAIGVLFRLQVGLEDRLQDQHRRRHDDTILNRRNPQRSRLSRLARLGYIHPADRTRKIPLRPKFFRQFVQPPLRSVLLDVLERLPIDAWRTAIGLADAVGVPEHISSIHLVVQRVESVVGRSLRFDMQRSL